MSNYLGNEILAQLKAKTGPLSPLCTRLLGFGSNRRLTDDDHDQAFELTAVWGENSLLGQLAESIDNERMIIAKENEIMDNQVDMKNITRAIKDRLVTLQETVDGIAKKLDMNPKKADAKSKKSKKAKSQSQDSEADDALFHRNLLAVEERMMDKFDKMESQAKLVESKVESIEGKVESMESKVDSMESKVESMENKVQSIEGKVDNMEKTMEEMKDMLSQLMMNRGAAEADA